MRKSRVLRIDFWHFVKRITRLDVPPYFCGSTASLLSL